MPFSSISIPSIAGWGSKSKAPELSETTVDLSSVSDGFGIPNADDPDPFGVHALEQAGLEIKEAGTQSRPTSETFEFKPSPTSPLFRHSFQSLDSVSRHGSVGRESVLRDPRRDSKRSMVSVDQGTQTVDLPAPPSVSSPPMSPRIVEPKPTYSSPLRKSFDLPPAIQENPGPSKGDVQPDMQVQLETIADGEDERTRGEAQEFDGTHDDGEDDDDEYEDEDGDDEFSDVEPLEIIEEAAPTLQIVAQKISSPTITRAKIVNIPRRAPPAIPVRNPRRRRTRANGDEGNATSSAERQDDSSTPDSPSPVQSNSDTENNLSRNAARCEQTTLRDMATVPTQDLDESTPEIKPENASKPERSVSVAEQDRSSDEASTPTADLQKDGGSLGLNDLASKSTTESQPIKSDGLRVEPLQESDSGVILKTSNHDLPTSQPVVPIGQMIKAGLGDDSDEDEPSMNLKSNQSTGYFGQTTETDPAVDQSNEIIAPPPRSPLGNMSSESLNDVRPIDETKTPIFSDSPVVPQREVQLNHHSPGLGSISSEDDATSRVHSTHTERENYASSISDYGDVEDTKSTDNFYSIPPTPSETSMQTPSLTVPSARPVGGAA